MRTHPRGGDANASKRDGADSGCVFAPLADGAFREAKEDVRRNSGSSDSGSSGLVLPNLPNDVVRALCVSALEASDHDAATMTAVAGVCRQWRREMKELALSGQIATRMSLAPRGRGTSSNEEVGRNAAASPRWFNVPLSRASLDASEASSATQRTRYVYCVRCRCLHASCPASMAAWQCNTVEELFLSGEGDGPCLGQDAIWKERR